MVLTTVTPHALALNRLDHAAKITVAGEQHDMVQDVRHLHHVDRDLDIHIALDLAPPHGVGELLGWLRDQRVAVVVEPVDQGPDRRIFLIFDEGGVIESANEAGLARELFPQTLIVNVETERTGGGVKIGAVDEKADSLFRGEFHQALSFLVG